MKPIKSALFFVVISGFAFSCFDPPEFDDSPSIKFESKKFDNKKTSQDDDILSITISFRDGDGDLGLDNLLALDSPYQAINFLANDNGNLEPVSAFLISDFSNYRYKKARYTPRDASYYIARPAKPVTELITYESRNQGFSLPPLDGQYTCVANKESYLNENSAPDTVFISRNASYFIRDNVQIVDTLVSKTDPSDWYYVVKDFFYVNVNERHTNIKVQFYYSDNGTFVEYDFRKENCQTFDGRFPLLSDDNRALEGSITYDIKSSGLYDLLGDRLIILKVSVMDRAGRSSGTIETEPFRLDDI